MVSFIWRLQVRDARNQLSRGCDNFCLSPLENLLFGQRSCSKSSSLIASPIPVSHTRIRSLTTKPLAPSGVQARCKRDTKYYTCFHPLFCCWPSAQVHKDRHAVPRVVVLGHASFGGVKRVFIGRRLHES